MAFERVGVELAVEGRRGFSRDLTLAESDVRGFGQTADRAADEGRRSFQRLNREVGQTRRQARLAGRALRGIGLGLAAGVAAVGFGAFNVLKSGFEGLGAEQAAAAQVEAGLKSTGNAAGVSAKQLGRYADAMERSTGIAKESVQDAQATLLTFTGVNHKVFDDAIGLAADLSTRFGGDMRSSALQLGKALNDPIKGVTALTRVGVSFTAKQKNQIKALVESGETLKAQKIILRELDVQVGGSAKAQGKTWDGLMARTGAAWGNIKESIAGAVEPLAREYLPKLIGWFERVSEWVQGNKRGIRDGVESAFGRIGDVLSDLSDWWDRNGTAVWNGVKGIAKAFVWVVKRAGDLVGYLSDNWPSIENMFLGSALVVLGAWQQIGNAILRPIEQALGVAAMIPGPWQTAAGQAYDAVKGFREGANRELDSIKTSILLKIDDNQARQDVNDFHNYLDSVLSTWQTGLDNFTATAAPAPPRRRRNPGKGGKGGKKSLDLSGATLSSFQAAKAPSIVMNLHGVTPETAAPLAEAVGYQLSKRLADR